MKRILRLADRDPSRLIGVIAPNNEVRQHYFDALRRLGDTVALDHEPPLIKTHFSGKDPSEISFDRGGILVINVQACKGLEFDVAMLADIDRHIVHGDDPDRTRRLFYVMVARARGQVFLFMRKGAGRAIDLMTPAVSSLRVQHMFRRHLPHAPRDHFTMAISRSLSACRDYQARVQWSSVVGSPVRSL